MFSKAIARLQETNAEAVVVKIIGDKDASHSVIYDRLPEAKGKEKHNNQKQKKKSSYPIYTVFRIDDEYYAYEDVEENLGAGARGCVLKACRIDPETAEKDESAPSYAVKIPTDEALETLALSDIVMQAENEVKIAGRFYKAKLGKDSRGLPIQLMEFIPGEQIFNHDGEPHPLLANLSFEQLNNLICQLYSWLNIFHHESPERGKAFAHRDIKYVNVHLFYNNETQQLELYLLDFDTALELDNEDEMQRARIAGTSCLFPPEMSFNLNVANLKGHDAVVVGTISDIFQAACLSLLILKGKDRFDEKNLRRVDFNNEDEAVKNMLHNATVPCDTTGFLEGIKVPELTFSEQHFDLSEIMHNFIQYALSLDYQSRATTDEALNFHLTVDNLCKLLKKNPANREESIAFAKEKLVYIAKLCVLSQGLWRTKIGKKLVDQHFYENESIHVQFGTHIVDKTFADFEFEPKQCVAILKAYQNKVLTENGELIQAIKVREEKKFKIELGESTVREKLNDIFNGSRENLNERLSDDHLEMILDVSLAGIHDYQKRNGSHLSFWGQMIDGERGKVRAENYKKIFENESYSLFTRMVVLYALLASHDGKTLQKDVAKSFQLLFKRDFRIEDLKPVILNIIRINKNENVTMAEIDCHIEQIVSKLDTKSIPSHEILREIESRGKAVPQSLHSRSRTL